jgi:hypothetical protein
MDYEKICDELWDDVECGPGENFTVLKRVESRLQELLGNPRATTYVREKVYSAQDQFKIWFSPRKWNQRGDGGTFTKMLLQQDIEKIRQACHVAFKNDNNTDEEA